MMTGTLILLLAATVVIGVPLLVVYTVKRTTRTGHMMERMNDDNMDDFRSELAFDAIMNPLPDTRYPPMTMMEEIETWGNNWTYRNRSDDD